MAIGRGKNTLMNALLQGAENMIRDKDMNIIPQNGNLKDLLDKEKDVFEITDDASNSVGLYLYHDIYYFDCPDLPYLQDKKLDLMMEYQHQTTIH